MSFKELLSHCFTLREVGYTASMIADWLEDAGIDPTIVIQLIELSGVNEQGRFGLGP